GIPLTRATTVNYTLASTTVTYLLTLHAALPISNVTANSKVYDGTPAATASCTLTGLVNGDAITCAGTATFDTASVGTGKTVTVTRLAPPGAAKDNYTLASTTASGLANITAVTLTTNVTPNSKVYDGTPAATATCSLTGLVNGDAITCAGTATFDTARGGTGKTVTVTGITLTGAAKDNYTLASTTVTGLANISAVTLTANVTPNSKVYDGTPAATASCTLTGLVNGDAITCAGTATFDSAL